MHRAWLMAILLIGCSGDDDGQDPSESSGAVTGDPDASTTGAATSAEATSSADDTSTDGTGSTTATDPSTDADSGPGPVACEPGLEPAEFTTVEGCDEVVGEPACSEGQEHVPQKSAVQWMSDPPHSGPHYPTWQTWGEHDSTVPRGNWVHNLEHGGIVLSYRCADPCETELEVLREVVAQRPELRILLTPDPLLPGTERFAAISWTWVHRFDVPDLPQLLCFADQHENHAPEDVP